MKKNLRNKGFTLIEVMITMTVLSVGILGVVAMQTTSVGGNSKADVLTTASSIAADQLEFLKSLPYDSPLLQDDPGGTGLFLGTAGLRNPLPPLAVGVQDRPDPGNFPADYSTTVTSEQNDFTIYWNIAEDTPVTNVKTVNVIVVDTKRGEQKSVILEYVLPEII